MNREAELKRPPRVARSALLGVAFVVILNLIFWGSFGLFGWKVWHGSGNGWDAAPFDVIGLGIAVRLAKQSRNELNYKRHENAEKSDLSAVSPKPSVIIRPQSEPNATSVETISSAPCIEKRQKCPNQSEQDGNDGNLLVHGALATPNSYSYDRYVRTCFDNTDTKNLLYPIDKK